MKLTIRDRQEPATQTYAGLGSDGPFLYVKGMPVSIQFDSVEEATEIAGAILAGFHYEIQQRMARNAGGTDA